MTTPTQLNANISLNVTPTVTNDGSVLMDLSVTRDITDSQVLNNQTISMVARKPQDSGAGRERGDAGHGRSLFATKE